MIYDHVDNGFYEANGLAFSSKIEAILSAETTGTFPTFNFHDAEYAKFDWNVEPSESLDQLYLKRALELRNKYDYLVLHYSGGSDSNNVLETFVKHGIPLDEIFMRGSLESTEKDIRNNSAANMFAEVFFNAYPIAQHVKRVYMPWLTIRVVDNTEYIINAAKSERKVKRIFEASNLGVGGVGPNLIASKDFDDLVPEWRKISESGKKVGHILGAEKPSVTIRDGEFFLTFLDKAILHLSQPRATDIDLPIYKEFFYWGENTGPLIIKQAHLIKKYVKQNNMIGTFSQIKPGRTYHDFLAKIIYPERMFPISFNTDKVTGSTPLMPWDNFFLKDIHSDHYINWIKQVSILDTLIPSRFKHMDSPIFNLLGILSKRYSIGF